MPPVVAAIALYFSVSAAMATFILVSGVIMVASIGYAAYAMASMPDMPGYSSEVRGRTQVVRSAVTPHRVIYGQCMVSGPLVAAFSAGDTNKFLYLVIVLAAHEVLEIGDVYLGSNLSTDDTYRDKSSTTGSYTVGSDQTITIESAFYGSPTVIIPGAPSSGEVDPGTPAVPITDFTISGRRLTFADSGLVGTSVNVTYLKTYVQITKYLGTLDQAADPDLIADAQDKTGNAAWTTAHTLTGRAYLIVRLEFNTDAYPQGIPNIKAVVKGVKDIYDPRSETTGYTDNWALCMRDYLVKSYGLRCTVDDINDDYFIAAANVSDETLQVLTGTGTGYVTDGLAYDVGRKLIGLESGSGTILGGDVITFDGDINEYRVVTGLSNGVIMLDGDGLQQAIAADAHLAVTVAPVNYERRYTCNGAFTLDAKPIDIIKKMLTGGAGRLVWSQGRYELYPAVYNTPEDRPLTESDLRDSISVVPAPSRRDRINTVRGTFVDPSQYWQQTDFPVIQNADALAADGEELTTSIELPYTISCATAQRIAKIHLERSLLGMVVTFPGKLTCFGYKPGNVVKLNIAQLGWVDKTFRVTDWKMADNGGVDLLLKEDSP